MPRPPKRGPLTDEQRAKKKQRFLAAYGLTANIKHSCARAGIHRSTFYEWRDSDPDFAAQLAEAEQEANDTLELALYDRAVAGVPSFVVSQGKLVYHEIPVLDENKQQVYEDGKPLYTRGDPLIERKYSDSLLTLRLKARMPEKYKDRVAQEHSGPGGGPIRVERVDLSRLSDDELAALEQMAKKADEQQ